MHYDDAGASQRLVTPQPVRSRRQFLVRAGATTLAATAALRASGIGAQDASPVASPVATAGAQEVPSQEATADQLAIARQEGDAFGRALAAMRQEAEVRTQTTGQYEVSLIAEKAEGLYLLRRGTLVWTPPGNANAHLEVVVRDAGDGRFIPGLRVSLALDAPDGSHVGTRALPLVWHPWLYHYGLNWKVPSAGDYTARIRIDVPSFPRHDQVNGNRYTQRVNLTFTIPITPGQK